MYFIYLNKTRNLEHHSYYDPVYCLNFELEFRISVNISAQYILTHLSDRIKWGSHALRMRTT